MSTRSGNSYLLDESSKLGSIPIEFQPILAEIMAKLEALTQIVPKLQAERKTPETEDTPSRNYRRDNSADPSNPNTQYMKSIKIDVSTFDGRHNPQLFLDWTLQLDMYFTWYELIESRKVKFVAMKLSGQVISIGPI